MSKVTNKITKKDLVLKISDETGLTKQQVMNVIQEFMGQLSTELSNGNSIVMRNFGMFEVLATKAKIAHNPKNPQQKVQIPERAVVKFRPGKELREKVAIALPKIKQA